MDSVDTVVIGAGVVGLAVAGELAGRYPGDDILVLEQHGKFGQETSSRNSEVIHAGIYYAEGSLKAKLCVDGHRRLYEFCSQYSIPHQQIGKIIVARDDNEVEKLVMLKSLGDANGVKGLELLDAAGIRVLELHVAAVAGLYSPTTGIVDSHRLMIQLEQLAVSRGAMLAYNHAVVGINRLGSAYQVVFRSSSGEEDKIKCSRLVNCAGLSADKVAAMLGIDVDSAGYRLYLCKGDYFSVTNSKAALVSRLIYPPPHRNLKGLGIHATKDLGGRLRLGPDTNYSPKINYRVNPTKATQFAAAVKSYLPFIEPSDLQPDTAGIRPKILAPCGAAPRDFIICHEAERGLPGVYNLLGIESPGLTACLSIAAMVGDLVKKSD